MLGAVPLLCWLYPEMVVDRVLDEIEDQAAVPLPPPSRPGRLRALASEKLFLQRTEERLICDALGRGEVVSRRSDADPCCVLQVKLVEERQVA